MNFITQIINENNKKREQIIKDWEKDKRYKISNDKKILFCVGCRQNFYNGHNPYNIKECWHLNKAKLKRRTLYLRIDSNETQEIITLNCFTRKYK